MIDRRRLMALMAGAGVAAGQMVVGGRRMAFAASDKVLRIQNDGDITNLDPANRGGWYDETVMYAIYAGLCQYGDGANWNWVKDGAKTLQQVDPLTIEFTLREGLVWTGGFGEVTAEDVKYSYERFADPKVKAVYKDDWDALDKVEVTGPLSGVIRLKRPFPALFASTLPNASGLIVSKKAVEKAGGLIKTDPLASAGPYKLAEWKPRQHIILARHEGWTGPAPHYDEIRLMVIEEEKTAEIAYDAGDLDMTKIEVNDIVTIKKKNDPETTLTVRPALAYTFVGMNVENEKLKDLRIRRAVQQAVDVQSVVDGTFGPGAVTRAFGLVPSTIPGARTAVKYPYDPAAAKRLLAEAGAEGLRIKLTFSNEDAAYPAAAQIIQAQLAEVGITLDLDQGDSSAQTAQQQDLSGGTWRSMEMFLITYTTAPDPGWVTAWFTCDQVGIWNWQHTCSKEWDDLNKAASAETDPDKRAAMYVTLQDQLEETGAYIFLYHGVNAWINKSSIAGSWTPDGGRAMLRNIKSV
jgi:peptide/nickel transport system substrate-binding protein